MSRIPIVTTNSGYKTALNSLILPKTVRVLHVWLTFTTEKMHSPMSYITFHSHTNLSHTVKNTLNYRYKLNSLL